jgi:hypothetical protein
LGISISTAEIRIPGLQQIRLVPAQQFLDSTDLHPGKPPASLQPRRLKLELCNFVFALNMNMRRFLAVAGIEEESVGTDP